MEIHINGKIISSEDFTRKLQEIRAEYSGLKEKLSEVEFSKIAFNLTKDKLIKNHLLLEEAERTIEPPSYTEIKKKYNEIKSHITNSESQVLDDALKKENEFNTKANIEKFLLVEKLTSLWVKPIGEDDLENKVEKSYSFFQENPQFFNFENYALFSRISTKLEFETELKELFFFLQEKSTYFSSFESILDTGFSEKNPNFRFDKKVLIKKGSLVFDIEEIIFSLSVGNYSGIIKTNSEASIFLKLSDLDKETLEAMRKDETKFYLIKDLALETYLKEAKKKIIDEKLNYLIKKSDITFH